VCGELALRWRSRGRVSWRSDGGVERVRRDRPPGCASCSIRSEPHAPSAEAIVIGAEHAEILLGRLASPGEWLYVIELQMTSLAAPALGERVDVCAARLIAADEISAHRLRDIAGTDRGAGIGCSDGVGNRSGRLYGGGVGRFSVWGDDACGLLRWRSELSLRLPQASSRISSS
jgi:hypothetical protein